MNTTVEGSNSADAFSPLDGGAGILLLRLEAVVWAGVSTDILLPAWVVFGVFLVRGLWGFLPVVRFCMTDSIYI
jgi:hypothetical protein